MNSLEKVDYNMKKFRKEYRIKMQLQKEQELKEIPK
jgi:hypothetical protein